MPQVQPTSSRWIRLCQPAFLLASLAGSSAFCGETVPAIRLAAPREFGHVLGDVIEHTLTVDTPPESPLDTGMLPGSGMVNDWLAIRQVEWQATPGAASVHYDIRIRYQVFRNIRAEERATIPGLPLHFDGEHPRDLTSPEWSFNLAPVIPATTPNEQIELREPSPPETLPLQPHRQRMTAALLLASLLGAALGFRRIRFGHRSRFATIDRQVRHLLRGEPDLNALRQSARLLHEGLNGIFGQTLFASQVEQFCTRHPAFARDAEVLHQFFRLSEQIFFSVGRNESCPPGSGTFLIRMARQCRQAEARRVAP